MKNLDNPQIEPFENWCANDPKAPKNLTCTGDGVYCCNETETAWIAWLAALESIQESI